LCSASAWRAMSIYLPFSSLFIALHMVPSLQITKGNTRKTIHITWGCEGWCEKIFTETELRQWGKHSSLKEMTSFHGTSRPIDSVYYRKR
jgi:hypothetical protein